MFIAALFTIPKTWKQPNCHVMGGWIQKKWYIYTMEYYSATKRLNIVIWNNVDGSWEYFAKEASSQKRTKIMISLLGGNKKQKATNAQTKQTKSNRKNSYRQQNGSYCKGKVMVQGGQLD